MADPVWTAQYNLAQTPENNGFTRTIYDSPVVNAVTSGSPANRRVEINSDNGSVIFITSSVPSLDPLVGATCEVLVQINGLGNAGFELTFLDRVIGVQVYQNRITIQVLDGNPLHEFSTADNSGQTRIRLTYGNGVMNLYRNAVAVVTNLAVGSYNNAFQRVLWWGEEGGTQIWRELKYYIGGVVAP